MAQTKINSKTKQQDLSFQELIKTAASSAPKHIISVNQFDDKVLLANIFARAAEFKSMQPKDYPKPLQDKIIATIFYEPSTRTRLSFETAAQRLGGQIISTENAAQFSSAAKGETLEDSIRTINGYADAIVLRHPEIGSAQTAANISHIPIVNAGDGAGDHPTQALLDLFTIKEAKGKIDGLKIGLVGDLLNGRTVHSLVHLLSMYKPEIICIAPKKLQLPVKYQDILKQNNISYSLVESWDDCIDDIDVLYMTRIQKERFESVEDYNEHKDQFILNSTELKKAKKDLAIMHPLPRVNEIAIDIDDDPRAIYFEQARNGLFVRMALLTYIFE